MDISIIPTQVGISLNIQYSIYFSIILYIPSGKQTWIWISTEEYVIEVSENKKNGIIHKTIKQISLKNLKQTK